MRTMKRRSRRRPRLKTRRINEKKESRKKGCEYVKNSEGDNR